MSPSIYCIHHRHSRLVLYSSSGSTNKTCNSLAPPSIGARYQPTAEVRKGKNKRIRSRRSKTISAFVSNSSSINAASVVKSFIKNRRRHAMHVSDKFFLGGMACDVERTLRKHAANSSPPPHVPDDMSDVPGGIDGVNDPGKNGLLQRGFVFVFVIRHEHARRRPAHPRTWIIAGPVARV